MIEFKIGDRVRCISAHPDGLVEGKEYVVKKVGKRLIRLHDEPTNASWFSSRFEKVESGCGTDHACPNPDCDFERRLVCTDNPDCEVDNPELQERNRQVRAIEYKMKANLLEAGLPINLVEGQGVGDITRCFAETLADTENLLDSLSEVHTICSPCICKCSNDHCHLRHLEKCDCELDYYPQIPFKVRDRVRLIDPGSVADLDGGVYTIWKMTDVLVYLQEDVHDNRGFFYWRFEKVKHRCLCGSGVSQDECHPVPSKREYPWPEGPWGVNQYNGPIKRLGVWQKAELDAARELIRITPQLAEAAVGFYEVVQGRRGADLSVPESELYDLGKKISEELLSG